MYLAVVQFYPFTLRFGSFTQYLLCFIIKSHILIQSDMRDLRRVIISLLQEDIISSFSGSSRFSDVFYNCLLNVFFILFEFCYLSFFFFSNFYN